MSFVDHSRAWIVCDAPGCDNEFVLSKAQLYGWAVTGTGEHLCPNHAPDQPDRAVVDVKALAAGER